jgi:glycosyltransferase involved in cell wall biosynthesis
MKISVCITTYNGEKYVKDQIDSIIEQLTTEDEIIVVDDFSTDNTLNIIESINDLRIKIFNNGQNKGHVYSFSRAISLANNEIIFMSDQDDIWIKGRVKLMVNMLLESGASVISSNSLFIDAVGNRIFYSVDGIKKNNSNKYFRNILEIFMGKTNYFGCAMALKKDICKIVLPIPSFVESHDLWIALASNLFRSNCHIDENTLYRRVHNSNASIINRGLLQRIWSRIIFLRSIMVLLFRGCRKS